MSIFSNMFANSKSLPFLKKTNNFCNKCLRHTSAKKNTSPNKNTSNKNKYSNTVLLPKTDFPLWFSGIGRIEQDEKVLKTCGFSALYKWQRENVKGPDFILHDGPPYANGMPHMGHAINKVLKDITCRQKLLQGCRVHYRPGWDCHGLPIELKAMSGRDWKKNTPLEIRTEARKYAREAVRNQKAMFQSWGVMADWDDGCYHTFDQNYVKNQMRQFYKLYEKGFVYQDLKPVYWSPSSRTALAEAELEYNEQHVSTTAYVQLKVIDSPWGEARALVWTTTPWTLVSNQALAYSDTIPYSLVNIGELPHKFIVATPVIEQISATFNKPVKIIDSINGNQLSKLHYEHPLYSWDTLPFLPSDHVTADKGTGLVHIAPAHGPDDFKIAKKFNIPIKCLVDEAGCFTAEAGSELEGLNVLKEGGVRILGFMRERDLLTDVVPLRHSYPYDWRTKQPVLLRASRQWFFDTEVVKERALTALEKVKIMPEKGMAGLLAQVRTRPYWCISRQRVWGVPVPVLYTDAEQPIISRELIEHYCSLLESEGDDFWWTADSETLAPPQLLEPLGLSGASVQRGQDILDIWLDSGLSWSAVLDTPTADLYLEGVDQFNGWFQSSLITSIALQDASPYKSVFVHGFAVDEKGAKMSKSIGNVVNPQEIVVGGKNPKSQPIYGVDVLRWWVAAHATTQTNIPVGPSSLNDSRDCVHRLRRLVRYLLGALDGIPSTRAQPPTLRHLDRYMLHSLHHLENQVIQMYNNFHYNRVCTTLNNFTGNEVSALYCHLTKDRLYCDAEDSDKRRAVQLTLYHTLNTLAHLVAPVLPVLAEEIYSYQPVKVGDYLFQSVGPVTRPEWVDDQAAEAVQLALNTKKQVTQLTPLNVNGMELAAVITAPEQQWELLKELQDDSDNCDSELCELLQVSHVTLTPSSSHTDVQVEVRLARLAQCDRCRRFTSPAPSQLCTRCTNVVNSL